LKLISNRSKPLHCWIIDMNLGNRLNEGLDIATLANSFCCVHTINFLKMGKQRLSFRL
jgi:hypothetical protein